MRAIRTAFVMLAALVMLGLALGLSACATPTGSRSRLAAKPSPATSPAADSRQIFIDVTTVRIPASHGERVLADLSPRQNRLAAPLNASRAKQLLATFRADPAIHVLQAPKLLVLEGQEGTMFVGERFVGESIGFAKTHATADGQMTIQDDSSGPVEIGYRLQTIAHPSADNQRVTLEIHEVSRQVTQELPQILQMGAAAFRSGYVSEQRLDVTTDVANGGYVLVGNPTVYEDKDGRYLRVSIVHARIMLPSRG